jgi:hypothetical protein
MRINQNITDNTNWTRKLFVGAGALALAAVLVTGGIVPQAQATECANSGAQTTAPDDHGVNIRLACGHGADASGSSSTAVGGLAQATGSAAVALGATSEAAINSTALGFNAVATGGGSSAVGRSADATGSSSTAVGYFASASAQGAVALGAGSVTDEVNTVSVGDAGTGLTRRITNVAMGARGNDAVTVKQLKKSLKKSFRKGKAKVVKGTVQTSSQNQASTTVAKTAAGTTKTKSSGGGSTSSGSSGPATVSQASFDQFASKTETQIDRLAQRDNKLAEGIAIVAALAQPVLLPGQHFAMRAGWGGYDSANAVAFSAAGVIADNLLRSGHGNPVA